jgi:hypothetical protein
MVSRSRLAGPVLVACGCLMAVAAGCGQSANQPAVAPTAGVVTYNGSPLANAQVVFIPADSSGSRVATGKTDASGAFVMSTFGKDDGAIPGDKLVTVVAQEEVKSAKEGNEPGSPGYVAPKELIPKKYFSEATSGLKASVVAGKQNRFEFALTDEKK